MKLWRIVLGSGHREPLLMLCAVWLTSWLLRGLYATLRPAYVHQHFEHRLLQSGRPCLVAFWHGRLLYLLPLYRRQHATVLVSRSRDGEFISQIIERFGMQPTRGSSSRGGVRALSEMVVKVRGGYHAAFTPDGPRGPRYRVQPGIVLVAKKTGAAILPITYNAQWKKVLRSWDRFVIPLPFSRIVVVYGEPIYVPAGASAGTLRAKRQEIEASLRRITEIADDYFRAPSKDCRPQHV
ncbi:hypothetical protein NKDENANG_03681 [Candidatus Entotheonellaceae bacterium PAL068K]